MYKFISATFVLLAGLIALVACQNEEEAINPTQAVNSEMEYVYLGEVNVIPVSTSRSEGDGIYAVSFKDEDEISNLHLTLIQNGSEYGCDVDENGEIDFYIKVLDSTTGIYQYLNKKKELLQEISLHENVKSNEFTLNVIKVFNNSTLIPQSRAENWSDCFSRRMGSSTGIILNLASSLIGPEGPFAVAAGAALSCAIWTPY